MIMSLIISCIGGCFGTLVFFTIRSWLKNKEENKLRLHELRVKEISYEYLLNRIYKTNPQLLTSSELKDAGYGCCELIENKSKQRGN